MSDFTAGTGIVLNYNTATYANADVTPVWTGTALQFGGTSGANELRWVTSGATTATASASWPFVTRTASTFAIAQLWAFTADTTGLQINAYDGTNAKGNVMRWVWDTSGTYAAAPQFSAFQSTAHIAPTPGDGTITGGATPDTGASANASVSYLKINAHDTLIAALSTLGPTGPVGTALTATTGTQALTPTTSADWLNAHTTWGQAQGFTQGGIILRTVPAATTANTWPILMSLWCGPNLVTGTLTPVITYQYSFS